MMMGGQYFKGSLLPIFQFTKLELTKAHTKGGTTLWDICVQQVRALDMWDVCVQQVRDSIYKVELFCYDMQRIKVAIKLGSATTETEKKKAGLDLTPNFESVNS